MSASMAASGAAVKQDYESIPPGLPKSVQAYEEQALYQRGSYFMKCHSIRSSCYSMTTSRRVYSTKNLKPLP